MKALASKLSQSKPSSPPYNRAMLALALLGLNMALSFHNVWPTPWISTRFELAVEAAVLVLLVALLTRWQGLAGTAMIRAMAILLTTLVVGRYADVTAPALYGRPVNLYWDLQHLPQVTMMLAQSATWWQLTGALLALLSGLAIIFSSLSWVVRRLALASSNVTTGNALIVASTVVIAAWFGAQFSLLAPISPWFSKPVTVSYAHQLALLREATDDVAQSDFDVQPLVASSLGGLAGADVIVLFIESYGATTFDKAEHANALKNARSRLAGVIAQTGRLTASTSVSSPTFGGGSWLAHSSFLSGFEVRDGRTYDRLLVSQRETWVRRFASAGYRTVGLVPGIRMAWPEGKYYAYDRLLDAKALDYQGPEFGWWRIPDQFSLARADTLEMPAGARQPVMMVFTTISSHAPFLPLAPYQPDWQKLLNAQPYGPPDAPQLQQALARKPDWTNLSLAYVESIDYALNTLAGYLERRAADELVVIVIGDHQPATSITGPDVSWQVPVHVITSNATIVERLRQQGFSVGLDPENHPLGPMHQLTDRLLTAFGDDEKQYSPH